MSTIRKSVGGGRLNRADATDRRVAGCSTFGRLGSWLLNSVWPTLRLELVDAGFRRNRGR